MKLAEKPNSMWTNGFFLVKYIGRQVQVLGRLQTGAERQGWEKSMSGAILCKNGSIQLCEIVFTRPCVRTVSGVQQRQSRLNAWTQCGFFAYPHVDSALPRRPVATAAVRFPCVPQIISKSFPDTRYVKRFSSLRYTVSIELWVAANAGARHIHSGNMRFACCRAGRQSVFAASLRTLQDWETVP